MNTFPVLTTERLILRQLAITDADNLLRLRGDESVNRYLNRPPQTFDGVVAFIHNINSNPSYYWVVALKGQPGLSGTICLWNFTEDSRTADIGYELLPGHQGKGIMGEALQAVLQYGFDTIGLKNIIGVTVPENTPSISLLARNGFELDTHQLFLSAEEAGNQVVYFRSIE